MAAAGRGVTVPATTLIHALLTTCRPWLVAALAVLACSARGEVQVRVIATDPAPETALGRDEAFHVRIAFTADTPINIWARPYFNGKPVLQIKSNAASRRSGSGETLGWFSLDARDEVDEIRIIIGGGNPWREWSAASYSVRLAGTGAPAVPRQQPAWIAELRQQEQQIHRQELEKRHNEPAPAAAVLWASGFMLGVLGLLAGGFAWPAWALWKWRGGWHLTAAVPALMMAFVVLRIVIDVARDPTSHNLWPLEIIMFGTGSLAIMGTLVAARWFLHKEP